jgi:hypothetical protein
MDRRVIDLGVVVHITSLLYFTTRVELGAQQNCCLYCTLIHVVRGVRNPNSSTFLRKQTAKRLLLLFSD